LIKTLFYLTKTTGGMNMKVITTILKIILAAAHTVMYSFTVIFVGLAKLIRAFAILAMVAIFITDMIGPDVDRTAYLFCAGLIVVSTLFEVFYTAIVDSIGDYLYPDEGN
jgi:hypothetical protein